MQMKIINLASVSRKKGNKNTNRSIIRSKSPQPLKKIEDLNNVVMGSTAKRKLPNEQGNPCAVQAVQGNVLKENFFKLRVPFYKSHHKQVHTEERLMTRSCEILFECIKPYKDIRVPKRKTNTNESKTIGSILNTNAVIYERKATRKVEFLSFSEETPKGFLREGRNFLLSSWPMDSSDVDKKELDIRNQDNSVKLDEIGDKTKRKTASSEDFITDVFSDVAKIEF